MTGWVYKIIRKTDECLIYIGSTFGQYFCLRSCAHTKPSSLTNGKQKNLYGFISENGGWDNFQIEIMNQYETLEETRTQEINLIQHLKPICNVQHKKTKEEKQQHRNEYQKQYLADHPEQYQKRLEYGRAAGVLRQEIHIDCPCGGRYTLQNKTNHYKRKIHQDYETSKNSSIRPPPETIQSNI